MPNIYALVQEPNVPICQNDKKHIYNLSFKTFSIDRKCLTWLKMVAWENTRNWSSDVSQVKKKVFGIATPSHCYEEGFFVTDEEAKIAGGFVIDKLF